MHSIIGCLVALNFLILPFNGIDWSRNIGTISYDIGLTVKSMDDGYVAMVERCSIFKNCCQLAIIKLDRDGKKLWEKEIPSDGENAGLLIEDKYIIVISSYKGIATLIELDGNGNILKNINYSFSFSVDATQYIIKCENDYIFSLIHNYSNSIVVRVNENGGIVWKRGYDGFASIAKMPQGYLIVETPVIRYRNYTMLYLYDANDSLIWSKEIDGIDYFAHSAINGFILSHYNNWAKYDLNGDMEWSKTFEKEVVISSCVISGNGYLMAGSKLMKGLLRHEPILIKLNEKGKEMWRKTYFMPRYIIGNFFLIYEAGFVYAEGNDEIIALLQRDAEPNAFFIYFPPFFAILMWFSFSKHDAIVVKMRAPHIDIIHTLATA